MNVLDAESCLQDIRSMIESGVIKVDTSLDIYRPGVSSGDNIVSSSSHVKESATSTTSNSSSLFTDSGAKPTPTKANISDDKTAVKGTDVNISTTSASYKCGICGSVFMQVNIFTDLLIMHYQWAAYMDLVRNGAGAGCQLSQNLQALLEFYTQSSKHAYLKYCFD